MAELHYVLAAPRPETHLYEVTLTARGLPPGPVDLRMPAWTPGSYLVRDHARHVQDFACASPWERVDKQTWRVRRTGAGPLKASYRVYANDLSVRTSHLDATHGYADGTSVFMYADGALDASATVTVRAPRGWHVDSGVPAVRGRRDTFRADDYHQLADGTFEMGTHRRVDFKVAGKRHRLAVWGNGNEDLDVVARDLETIVREEVAMMGGAPYPEYLFILHLVDGPRGGLEHLNSNTSQVDRWTFRPPRKYEDFLSLEAHEFFHVWNVKRMKPAAFVPYDYERENYTRLLWAMEGLTGYYDHLVLARTGLVSEERYRDYLGELVTRLRDQPGRLKLSLEESSLLAWVKLYKADENWMNSGVSYYLKGELVGVCLDLAIRDRTGGKRTLDDVMREVYRRHGPGTPGIPEDGWRAALEDVTGSSWRDFWRKHVEGAEELDVERYLALVGWRVEPQRAGADPDAAKKGDYVGAGAWLGAAIKDDHGRLKVKHVLAGSPAEAAGLAAGHEVVALDGYRARDEDFVKHRLREKRPGDPLALTVFRGDALATLEAELAEPPPEKWKVKEAERPTASQKRLRAAWLAPYTTRRATPRVRSAEPPKRRQARRLVEDKGE